MGVAGEVTTIPEGEDQNRQVTGSPVEPREWYFRASAEFSSCVVSRELEQIARYVTNTDTRARNLGVLWMTDPFQQELFIQEAGIIVDTSDGIAETVARLKDTAVRFVHASLPEDGKIPRSRRGRRRIVRHRTAPLHREHQDPGHPCGGTS